MCRDKVGAFATASSSLHVVSGEVEAQERQNDPSLASTRRSECFKTSLHVRPMQNHATAAIPSWDAPLQSTSQSMTVACTSAGWSLSLITLCAECANHGMRVRNKPGHPSHPLQ